MCELHCSCATKGHDMKWIVMLCFPQRIKWGCNEKKKTAKNKTTVIIAWGVLAMFVCPRKGRGFRLSMAGIKLEQAPCLCEPKHWVKAEFLVTYCIVFSLGYIAFKLDWLLIMEWTPCCLLAILDGLYINLLGIFYVILTSFFTINSSNDCRIDAYHERFS